MSFDVRRRIIAGAGGGAFAIPTFTGSHAIFGDAKQGYIECYSTGTITFPKAGRVDVFVLGSGLKGGTGTSAQGGSVRGAKGGKGAVGTTLIGVDVEGEYTIAVGAACTSATSANKSTAFGATANSTLDNGGSGGTVYGTGSVSAAAKGSNGTSYPFGETSGTFYKQFGAGGGGGGVVYSLNGYNVSNGGAGGTLGGGSGQNGNSDTAAVAGTSNTGSGGGGGRSAVASSTYTSSGGNGGSGIVIIRWGYAA